MPQLPDFSKEIANSEKFLAANPEKKEDVLLLLFALLYQNQNSNSFEAYNFLFALLEKISHAWKRIRLQNSISP